MFDRARYLDQPFEVAIETLALCNAACDFCPYPTLERLGTKMEDNLIELLIDEMATFQHPFFFSPFKVNEPLLDPRLLSICETFLIRCLQGTLRLFTNGTPLNSIHTRRISALPRVEHVWCSLNSMDELEHHRLMQFKKPMLPKILMNLDALHAMKLVGDFPHKVVVSRVAQGTAHDIEFIRRAQRRWPHFAAFLIKKDAWLQDIDAPKVPIPSAPCSRWWELSICADGKASLCCMDSKGQFAIGNVHRQSLRGIYNTPAWKARRESLLHRHQVPVCQTCSY